MYYPLANSTVLVLGTTIDCRVSLQSMVQHTIIGGMGTSGVMAWCFPGSGTRFNPPVGSFKSGAIAVWLVQLWLYHFFLSRNCLISMVSSNHMVIFCTCTLYCTEIIYSASLTLQCPMHAWRRNWYGQLSHECFILCA